MTLYSSCIYSDILSLAFAKTHPSQTLSCLLCDVSHWIVTTFYPTNLCHSPNPSLPIQNILPSLLLFPEVHCILSPQCTNFVITKAYYNGLGVKHSRNSTIVYQALIVSSIMVVTSLNYFSFLGFTRFTNCDS
jgi:hypothetical protein